VIGGGLVLLGALATMQIIPETAVVPGDRMTEENMALLHNHGYAGYLSGEWINWEPHEVHLPRELATLQEIATEIQQKSETRD